MLLKVLHQCNKTILVYKTILFVVCIISVSNVNQVKAQETQLNYWQLWFDAFGHYTFRNGLRYSAEISPQTILNSESNWSSVSFSNTIGYTATNWLDLTSGLRFNYTEETDTIDIYNNYEITPWIGVILDFTPNSKIWISNRTRFEYRYRIYYNVDDNSSSTRLRNRLNIIYSINGPNFYQDKLWYLIGSLEYFFPISENPDERFANQATARLGIGYRNSYTWRYEFLIHEKFTKNTIDEEFSSTNSIFNLRLVCFLLPKSTKQE